MTKRTIIAGCIALLAASAAAGILAGRQSVAEAQHLVPPRFGELMKMIPSYPGAVFYPMGEELRVGGSGREMGYAMTPDSSLKVADRYEAVWTSQGFEVKRRERAGEVWVSAHVPGGSWIRTVGAIPKGEQTVIVASVGEMFDLRAPEAPIPEGCTVLSSSGSKDFGMWTELLFIRCPGQLRELVDFYDGKLARSDRDAGLVPESNRSVAHVTYASEDTYVTLTAHQGEGPEPFVTASLNWQEERQ